MIHTHLTLVYSGLYLICSMHTHVENMQEEDFSVILNYLVVLFLFIAIPDIETYTVRRKLYKLTIPAVLF